MKEKIKTYSAEDFARYHSGKMSPGEMHALEKAALEDPFLEDALEGYAYTSTGEKDIAELESHFAEKHKKKSGLLASLVRHKWWQVAALFIIIAGGYFFYRLNSASKEDSLSKNDSRSAVEKSGNAPGLKTDSAGGKNDIAFENAPLSKSRYKGKTAAPAASMQTEKNPVPDKNIKRSITGNSAAISNDVPNSAQLKTEGKDNVLPDTGYILRGKVTDQNGDPVPFASISDTARNKTTVADATGRFSINSGDSSIMAVASATGYNTKRFMLNKNAQPLITMSRQNDEQTAVVTMALGAQKQLKKSPSELKALNGNVSRVEMTPAGVQPKGGDEKFQEYLKENLRPIHNANNEVLTGDVLLSFKLNKDGRPENIKVKKSSCEACETEAIRLLATGPDWVGNAGTPGTVVIKF